MRPYLFLYIFFQIIEYMTLLCSIKNMFQKCPIFISFHFFYQFYNDFCKRGSVNKAHFVTQPNLLITPIINLIYGPYVCGIFNGTETVFGRHIKTKWVEL